MNIKTVFHITLAALCLAISIVPARAKTIPEPKSIGPATGSGSILIPQLLDGNSYRTIIYIQNFGAAEQSYQLNLLNENGTPALFHVQELGGVTGSLSGTLPPMGVTVYHTNSGAAGIQIGWGYLDYPSTGPSVMVRSVIESADPITGKWTTQSLIEGFADLISSSRKAMVSFDQTLGFRCGVALVNLSPSFAAPMIIEALDANGVVMHTDTLTLQPYNHVQFTVSGAWTDTIGIAGTVRISPANPMDILQLSIMGIKATAYADGWTQTSLPVTYVTGAQ
jgi:hypothetical protein